MLSSQLFRVAWICRNICHHNSNSAHMGAGVEFGAISNWCILFSEPTWGNHSYPFLSNRYFQSIFICACMCVNSFYCYDFSINIQYTGVFAYVYVPGKIRHCLCPCVKHSFVDWVTSPHWVPRMHLCYSITVTSVPVTPGHWNILRYGICGLGSCACSVSLMASFPYFFSLMLFSFQIPFFFLPDMFCLCLYLKGFPPKNSLLLLIC